MFGRWRRARRPRGAGARWVRLRRAPPPRTAPTPHWRNRRRDGRGRSTACWAPFMPPGSGAIRATAATMRTISQAPKPNRPSRAVSSVPAIVCQTSRNPANASTPPLKTNSMSPSTELPPATDIAEEGKHVPRRPVGIGEQATVDGLRRRRFGQQPRNTRGCDKYRSPASRIKKADTGKGTLPLRSTTACLPLACWLPRRLCPSHASRSVEHRPAPGAETAASSGPVRPEDRTASVKRAGQLRGKQEAERAHGGQFAPAAGLASPGRRRMRSAASANPVASIAPRRSSSR